MASIFSIVIRKGGKINAKGLAPVNLRMNVDGQVYLTNTGIKLDPIHFNEQKECILKTAPDYNHVNGMLEAFKAKALTYKSKHDLGGTAFEKTEFDQFVFGKKVVPAADSKNCFYTWLNAYANKGETSASVFWLYVRTGERLKELYPKLNVADVGFDVLEKFKGHLKYKYGNSPNTVRNHIKSVKAVVHYAQKMGIATNSTMACMTCPTVDTERHHLSCEEQTALYDLYMSGAITNRQHYDTVGAFLLSSYTGLRYSDMKKLEGQGAVTLDAGCMSFVPQKTVKLSEKKMTIPLSDNAIALIEAGALNRIFTNQRCNVYIKEALEEHLKITEKITFHCARHTFATNCIEKAIPIEIIQQYLGHAKISTTMIYAKVSEKVKAGYMKNWNAPIVAA